MISARMKQYGYSRSPEQCKCKWKNLVTRYKECESDAERGGAKKKRKLVKGNHTMEGFMKQQMQMEMQWLKAYEEKEDERREKEMEWRQKMEATENERIMMDRRWREREEQRKVREEARAEKRDALINAVLFKPRREGN